MSVCAIIMPAPIIYLGLLMALFMVGGMLTLGFLYAVAQSVSNLLHRFRRQGVLTGFEREMDNLPGRVAGRLSSAVLYWSCAGVIALGYMGLTMLIHTLLCHLKG